MAGKACHARIIHFGLQKDTLTCNLLMNVYYKCGLCWFAHMVFDKMPERSLVSWNTMISSHTQSGEEQEALALFLQMRREGSSVSEFTVSSLLCACAGKSVITECKQLHGFSIKSAMDSNVFVGTALLDVYSKCSLLKDAIRVFDSMPTRNEVTWSSMVAGYAQNELYEDALELFRKAQVIGLEHNQYTISSAISACASLAALIEGKQVHSVSCKTGFGSNIFVASSLIDMYAKCASIREAYVLFSGTEEKNIVLWNVMITGFAKHACAMEVMILFEKMQQGGIYPNESTYASLLSACSHRGLVEKGQRFFDLMKTEHELFPNVVHYSCLVDILGRAGLISKAVELIGKMPFVATASMWGSVLASCRVYGNLEVAEIAAKNLFEMEPGNAGNHVLLSNTYSVNKQWEEVATARKLLRESDMKKVKGMSWIEIKDKVHTFMVGERNHPRIAEIDLKLENLVEDMKRFSYRPKIEHDLHNVDNRQKQELLRHHSEKLAFTLGLICLPVGVPIRIMKNIRICGDCHSFMEIASRITGRQIIVRDTSRFHHFKDGCCSCGEFW